MRRKKETDEQFFARLINKMFEIAGHTDINYDILVANKEQEDAMPFGEAWYQRYTWNKEQEEEFRKWAKLEVKKRHRSLRGKYVDREIAFFILGYGLKCSDCYQFLKQEEE